MEYPREYDSDHLVLLTLDSLDEKELNVRRVQAMFKRSRHNNISIFIISQDFYEFTKKTVCANGNLYHLFNFNNFRDVQNFYQDKSSMHMNPNEFYLLTSTC